MTEITFRRSMAFAALSLVASAIYMALMGLIHPGAGSDPSLLLWWTPGLAFMLLGFGLFWRAGGAHRVPRREVDLSWDDAAITVGERRIPRSRILDAMVGAFGNDTTTVDIQVGRLPGNKVLLQVPDAETGAQLLERMRLGPEHRVTSYLVVSHPWWIIGTFLALIALAVLSPWPVASYQLHWILTPLLVLIFAPRFGVGADGVHVRRLFRSRFIAYDEVAKVAPPNRSGVGKLVLTNGEKLPFALPMAMGVNGLFKAQRRPLYQTLDAAWRRHRDAEAGVAADLARQSDPVQWVNRLRGLTERATHRRAAVALDDLWRVLESPSAPALERAAAAVALTPSLDAQDRTRIAEIANNTASKKLRVVLESPGASDEELAEMLAELEAQEEPPQHAELDAPSPL